jgi:hypothetical protein
LKVKNATRKNLFSVRGLPTLAVVSGSFAALPAAALELGDITVQSRLGQPLRASIAFALAPNEQVSNRCVTLRPGASVSGLPGIGNTSISVANGVIMLRGATALREPMVSAHIVINCPYSANISREYMLFIDPATPAYEAAAVTQQVAADTTPVAVAPAAIVASVGKPPAVKDIGPSTSYLVQSGDSVSEIAQRIEDRGVGLWTAVDAIFAANPDAFINNDPNRLKAGSTLLIPSFNSSAAVVANTVVANTAEVTNDSANVVIEAAVADASVANADLATADLAPADSIADETTNSIAAETTDDLKPANAGLDDNPYVGSATSENTVIPDTSLEGPQTTSASPNVTTASLADSSAPSSGEATPSWIFWLAGGGIALILGLLMFGRRFRTAKDSAPLAPMDAQENHRRASDLEQDVDTERLATMSIDHDLSDDSPTAENLALDAELVIGAGLKTDSESLDINFADITALDIELPFEEEASVSDKTDILPPLRTDEFSILESEVLSDDADDYDMSVIIDATKMPRPDEVPEHDLKAVEIVNDDETADTDSYTINEEVDYQVLEQDYEDEMTATQALNAEIARAALELTIPLDDDNAGANDETMALPLASVTALDITAQMPAQNDDESNLEETELSEEITLNQAADGGELTVEMPMESSKVK